MIIMIMIVLIIIRGPNTNTCSRKHLLRLCAHASRAYKWAPRHITRYHHEWSGLLVAMIISNSAGRPGQQIVDFSSNIDIALRRFSENNFSWLQNDQQDELHLQLFKISRNVILLFWSLFGHFL